MLTTYKEIQEFVKTNRSPLNIDQNIDQNSLIVAYAYFHGTFCRYGSGLRPLNRVWCDLNNQLFNHSIENYYLSSIQDEGTRVRKYYSILVKELYN